MQAGRNTWSSPILKMSCTGRFLLHTWTTRIGIDMYPWVWQAVWSLVFGKTLLMPLQMCPPYGKLVCALKARWKICYAFSPFWIWSLAMEFQTRVKLFVRPGNSSIAEAPSCCPEHCVPYSEWNKRILVRKAQPFSFPWWDVHVQLTRQRKAMWYPRFFWDWPVLIQLVPSRFWKVFTPFANTPTTSSFKQCYVPCFSRWYGMTAFQTA